LYHKTFHSATKSRLFLTIKCYFGQYLIGLRLNEAARLLSSGTHNVKHAAEAVGFSDIYYFSRLFKKRFLCPPSNYRNRMPEV